MTDATARTDNGIPVVEPDASAQRRRAAIWLWWLGGVETTICIPLLIQTPQVARLSPEEIFHLVGTTTADPRLTGTAMARALLFLFGLLGLFPALCYVMLAFAVRTGRRPAMWAVLVGLYGQLAVVSFYLLILGIASLRQGNPVMLSLVVLGFGTAAALLFYGARAVLAAQRVSHWTADVATDPWRSNG